MKFSREWCMPNKWTFEMKPVAEFIQRWKNGAQIIVDPFCGKSMIATHRNDLIGGVEADEYIAWLWCNGVVADMVLLDPPYSPRQMSEAYKMKGIRSTTEHTQNARLYANAKSRLNQILKPGGIALTFGWNSCGFGEKLGFVKEEILLVSHGAAHNDTICVAETKQLALLQDGKS